MSYFRHKKPKHKSTAWMADRFIAVARDDARLQGKWLAASVFFEAVGADEYRDGSDQSSEKLEDKFTLRNFKLSINKRYQHSMSNFDGGHEVLWERGWIDDKRLKDYHLYTRDEAGEVIPEISLIPLMNSCTDFADEITELQAKAHLMGVECMLTPKYHCELAGEGIEYAWGVAKARYRAATMDEKRTIPGFRELVHRCLSDDDKVGIPTRLARKFGMKARSYICAYFAYETTDKDGVGRVSVGQSNSPNQPDPVPSFNYKQIQKLQKEFKVHRGAIDFDKAFIFKSIMQIEKGK